MQKKKAKKRAAVAGKVKRGTRKVAKSGARRVIPVAKETPVRQAGEEPATIALAGALENYAQALAQLGFLSGPTGKQRFSRQTAPLLRALHMVLAGGKLDTKSLRVEGEVDRSTVRQLDVLAMQALDEANIKNRGVIVFYG